MTPKSTKVRPVKASIVSMFAIFSFILSIPVFILFSQKNQNGQSSAAEPTPTYEIPFVPSAAGSISGYVFNDTMKNGVRMGNENGIPNILITISVALKGKDQAVQIPVYTAKTDQRGFFLYHLTNTNPESYIYTVTASVPNGFKTINANPVRFTNLHPNSKILVQVGLFHLAPLPVTSGCLPRPACLNSVPRCALPEPANGWCP